MNPNTNLLKMLILVIRVTAATVVIIRCCSPSNSYQIKKSVYFICYLREYGSSLISWRTFAKMTNFSFRWPQNPLTRSTLPEYTSLNLKPLRLLQQCVWFHNITQTPPQVRGIISHSAVFAAIASHYKIIIHFRCDPWYI